MTLIPFGQQQLFLSAVPDLFLAPFLLFPVCRPSGGEDIKTGFV